MPTIFTMAAWAARKAAELEQQLAALPKAEPGDWRARVRHAQAAQALVKVLGVGLP